MKMFECNTDYDFDDELLGDSYRPEAPKRSFENETSVEANKKPCLSWSQSTPTSQTQALNFLVNQLQCKSDSELTPTFAQPTRHNSFSSPAKKVVHRKFPGPAGLLPERKDFKIDIKALEEQETKQDVDLCSQMSVKAFREGPWEQMSRDFRTVNSGIVFLPDKYNVTWIKAKVKANKLINQKAPFLAAVVQSIECSKSKTAVVTLLLKDATGQIHGTIVHDLYEEYINVLKIGSVIILKQFGVLTTDHGTNHNVTITANNLVRIYTQRSEVDATVTITTIQNVSIEDLLKNITEVKSKYKTVLLERKFNPDYGVFLDLKPTCDRSVSGYNNYKTDKSETFISPHRNLSVRTTNNVSANIRSGSDQNCLNLSSSYVGRNISSSKLNVSTESLGLASPSIKKRFNFKSHINNSNKPSVQGDMSESQNQSAPATLSQSTMIKCSQISIRSDNVEHCAILQNVFEGVDADLLFEDF